MYQYTASGSSKNFHHYDAVPFPSPLLYTGVPGLSDASFSPTSWACTVPSPPPPRRFYPPQRYVAVAVICVHTGTVKTEKIPMVARVSITDYWGNVLLDTYVRPTYFIEDYRTAETGLQYGHLANAPHFGDVQRQVAGLVNDKILVGHGLWTFLSVMGLSHTALETRDLALYRPLRKKLKSRSILSLSTLVYLFMGRNLGLDYENSLETARASIDLFRSCEVLFEGKVAAGGWPCDLPPTSYAPHYC